MSTRYKPLLDKVVERLAAINPGRVVTRNWDDFANRPEPEMKLGVWMVRSGGIARYPYEVSDGQFDSDSLRATEHGRLRISIVCQQLLDIQCTGEQVDDAEFVMIRELEQLADDAIEIEELMALKLDSVSMSQQIEKPYAWVVSTWEVFSLN